MTLRAYLITMRGRIREALVPELQVLRDQNRDLRARRPLTDQEIDDIWNRYCDEMGEASINDAYDIARAIERAHKIGGNDE